MASGWFTVVPASFVMDLGSAMQLRMLAVSDAEFAELRKLNPGFVRHTIKGSLYKEQGVTEDVQTFQSPTVLMASSKTAPDVVYKITKAVVEGRDEFGNVATVMKGVTAADMAHRARVSPPLGRGADARDQSHRDRLPGRQGTSDRARHGDEHGRLRQDRDRRPRG